MFLRRARLQSPLRRLKQREVIKHSERNLISFKILLIKPYNNNNLNPALILTSFMLNLPNREDHNKMLVNIIPPYLMRIGMWSLKLTKSTLSKKNKAKGIFQQSKIRD